MNDVDVILWLVEPTNFIGAGERHIIEQLKKTKTPVILVINKTDTVKRKRSWRSSIPIAKNWISRRSFRCPH